MSSLLAQGFCKPGEWKKACVFDLGVGDMVREGGAGIFPFQTGARVMIDLGALIKKKKSISWKHRFVKVVRYKLLSRLLISWKLLPPASPSCATWQVTQSLSQLLYLENESNDGTRLL